MPDTTVPAVPAPLQAAVDAFAAAHPETLDPARVRDLCRQYSEAFGRDLEHRGDCGDWLIINGLKVADGWLILAGHFAVQVAGGLVVGGLVVDWTYRQFDPGSPVPRVTTLAQWRAEWVDVTTLVVQKQHAKTGGKP